MKIPLTDTNRLTRRPLGGSSAIAIGQTLLLLLLGLVVSLTSHAQSNQCVSPPAGLVSWWRAEQNATDALGSNSGDALNGVRYTNGPSGSAFYFDGGDDRVIVPDSASLNFGTGDFSIEAWIKPETAVTAFGVQSIANKRYTPNSFAAVGWEFGLIDGKLACQLADAPLTGGDFSTFVSASPDLRDGNYHHVALSIQRGSSTGGKLLVDGQVVLVFDPTSQPGDLSTTEPLRIGAHADASLNSHFTGAVDELSIYNRALSETELQQIFTAGAAGKCLGTNPVACVSAPAGLVSWWRGENDSSDSSGGNVGILRNGATFADGNAGRAFYFSGSNDCVEIPHSPSLIATNYTIEAWVKPATQVSDAINQDVIFGQAYGHCQLVARPGPTGLRIVWQFGASPFNFPEVQSTTEIPIGQFSHIAGTWDGTTLRLYINGVLNAETTPGAAPVDSGCAFFIGGFYNPTADSCGYVGQFFNGKIDEVSFYNRALTANEVSGVFLAASAGKCLTTNPPISDCATLPAGVISWWRGESNFLDSAQSNHGSSVGGVSFVPGKAGLGMRFDGTSHVVIPHHPSLDCSNALTIELWYKPDLGYEVSYGLIDKRVGGAGANYGINLSGFAGLGVYYDDAAVLDGDDTIYGSVFEASRYLPAPTSGVFHHLAATFQQVGSNTVQLETYLDGQRVRTKLIAGNLANTLNTTPVTLGSTARGAGEFFKGIMDEVTLYSRVLTAAEIQAIYAADDSGKCTGPNPPPCIPGSADMVGWWRAENNATDSISGNHGVLQSGGSYAPGQVGQAFVLNGAGAGVRIAASAALDVGTQAGLTAEAWIFPANVSSGGPIVEWSRDPGGSPYGAHLWAGHPSRNPGYFFANLADTDGNWRVIEKEGALVTNVYQHVAVTYDRTTGLARLFVNGAMVQESNLGIFTPRTSDHLFIGRRPVGDINDYAFAGQIDEVGIYRRALTPAEILAIYHADRTGKCPPTAVPPGITQQPQSVITNVNTTARFEVVATGIPTPNYQWFFAGDLLAGQTNASLVLNNVQPAQAGNYFVIAANPSGAVTSSVATLTVLTYPPVITRQPTNVTVIESTAASFSVQATGSVTLAYQWLFNDQPLAGKTTTTLSLSNVQFTNAGNYSVIVTNPYGAVTSSVATVTVNPRPPCASVHDGLVSWWRGETNALDGWDSNNGNNLGRTYVAGKVGRAFASPNITVPDSASLAFTNELTIEAWINPATTSGFNITPILIRAPQFFPGGLAFTSSYLLGLTNQNRLSFSVGVTSLVSTQAIPMNVWTHVAASYSPATGLRLFINGQLVANRAYVAGIPATSGITYIGAAGIQGGIFGSFPGLLDEVSLYRRALSAAEIQSIVVADLTGKCFAPPVITQQPPDQTVPLGEDVKFSVAVSGSRPLAYQWYFNGFGPQYRIIGATNASLLIEKVRPNDAGHYFVTVSNSVGSDFSIRAQLSTLPAPSCVNVLPGLISWWPGDGNSADALFSNSISLYSPATYPTGKVGQAFTFNGTFSRLQINNSPALNFNTNADFSIEMWIKANPTNTQYPNVPIFEKRTSATTGWVGYSLSLAQGRLAFAMGTPGISAPGPVSIYTSPGPDLRDAMFHHVAVTVNRDTTNGGVLYVDGLPVLTFDPRSQIASLVNSSPLYIGSPATTLSNSFFSGLIDEPAIYNRALTAEEILAIRQAGAAGKCRVSPSILTQPVGQVVNIESNNKTTNATLSVEAAGSPLLRYQWFRSGAPIFPQQGGDKPSLVISNVQSFNSGNYWVRVTNLFGSVTSSNALLTVNNQPWALGRHLNTTEDIAISTLLQAFDGNQNPLTYHIVMPPTNGTLSGSAPNLLYTPKPNVSGADSFIYKVNDGYVDSTNATVTINIRAVNDAPVARSQIIATDEDVALPITLGASDADGDALTFNVSTPTHGTLSGTPPQLVYTPDTNYFGDDLFTFTVQDSSNAVSQLAVISLTVRPVNDAPVAKLEITPLDELPGVTNFIALAPACCDATLRLDASASTDVENDTLSYAWVEGTNVLATGVTVTNRFKPGTREIILLVSDGPNVTATTMTVEIITPAEGVAFLKTLVEEGITDRRTRAPLVNWLRQAGEAFERCQVEQGVKFLEMFKERVQSRIAPKDAELAAALIETATAIIEAAPDCDPCHRLGRKHKDKPGKKDESHDHRSARPESSQSTTERATSRTR